MHLGGGVSLRQNPPSRRTAIATVLVVALAASAFSTGVGLAALTVSTGAESGDGDAETASSITWWHLVTIAVDTIPGGSLPLASANSTIPTILPSSNSSFALNPSSTGHGAIRLDFQEKNGPPGAKEFELSVTFLNASAVPAAATVFFETQFPVPGTPLTFSLFLDVGAVTATFKSIMEVAQNCATLGSCP